jgi:hypothetical protein
VVSIAATCRCRGVGVRGFERVNLQKSGYRPDMGVQITAAEGGLRVCFELQLGRWRFKAIKRRGRVIIC